MQNWQVFCLQQAVEKFLKAFLLSKGWKLRRIHNLDALLDDALEHCTELEPFRALCQQITALYFVERYPLFTEIQVTTEDVRRLLSGVEPLVERLRLETKQKPRH